MLEFDILIDRDDFRLEAQGQISAPVSGLFGPSGSGKTTLLHCIAGLVKPDRGRMVLNGEVLFDGASRRFVPPHQRHVGLVFQDAQLFPHLSVKGNLLFGFRRRKPSERRFALDDIVELLEIGHLLERHARQLSGGEKQRVALGRALLFSPQLLLLDEPLAALDQKLKRQILPFLRRIRDEVKIPMLYVSHALDEILYLTHTLTMIDRGRIQGHGPYMDVLAQNNRSELTQTIELHNLWTVQVVRNHPEHGCSLATLGEHQLIVPLAPVGEGPIDVVVRATQVALTRERIGAITIQNQLEGRIVRFIPRTHGTLVEIDAGVPVLAEVSGKAIADLQLQPGDTVYCLIKAQAFEYPDG